MGKLNWDRAKARRPAADYVFNSRRPNKSLSLDERKLLDFDIDAYFNRGIGTLPTRNPKHNLNKMPQSAKWRTR